MKTYKDLGFLPKKGDWYFSPHTNTAFRVFSDASPEDDWSHHPPATCAEIISAGGIGPTPGDWISHADSVKCIHKVQKCVADWVSCEDGYCATLNIIRPAHISEIPAIDANGIATRDIAANEVIEIPMDTYNKLKYTKDAPRFKRGDNVVVRGLSETVGVNGREMSAIIQNVPPRFQGSEQIYGVSWGPMGGIYTIVKERDIVAKIEITTEIREAVVPKSRKFQIAEIIYFRFDGNLVQGVINKISDDPKRPYVVDYGIDGEHLQSFKEEELFRPEEIAEEMKELIKQNEIMTKPKKEAVMEKVGPQAAKFKVGDKVLAKFPGFNELQKATIRRVSPRVDGNEQFYSASWGMAESILTTIEEKYIMPSEIAEAEAEGEIVQCGNMVVYTIMSTSHRRESPRTSYDLDMRPVFEPIFHNLAGQSAIVLKYNWPETAGMMVHDESQVCFECDKGQISCVQCKYRRRK